MTDQEIISTVRQEASDFWSRTGSVPNALFLGSVQWAAFHRLAREICLREVGSDSSVVSAFAKDRIIFEGKCVFRVDAMSCVGVGWFQDGLTGEKSSENSLTLALGPSKL